MTLEAKCVLCVALNISFCVMCVALNISFYIGMYDYVCCIEILTTVFPAVAIQ